MKILHVTPSFHPHLGGVETHVMSLGLVQAQNGHQVRILTPQFDKNFPELEADRDFGVIRFKLAQSDNKLNQKILTWQAILQQVKLFLQADIIIVHDVMWWLIPLWPLIFKKVYLVFHGWEGVYPVPNKFKLARFIWSKLAIKTIHVGAWIREFYWDKPDQVIYGGVWPIEMMKNKSKKLKLAFLGRLETTNDLDQYLKLIKKIKSKHDVEVTWIGDGTCKKQCQKFGKVTGMVENPDQYLAQADMVFASSYLSILEAMSLGKIVVALYSHPLKQRYLENFPGQKLMLMGDNLDQVEIQISQLLSDKKLLQKYQQASYMWANQQTWQKVAKIYENLWKK